MHSTSIRYFPLSPRARQSLLSLDKTLKGLCFSGRLLEAVDLLCRKGSSADPQTYALLLQEAINRKEAKVGRRIHAQMITTGFVPLEYLRTKLVIFYAKNGYLETAHQIFDRIPHRDLVSWNAMISGYVQNGLEQEGLNLYYSMRSAGLEPDQFTFASVFRACARLALLEHGKRAHCAMIKTQMKANVVVNSALVDMYFKCSSLSDGFMVFKSSSERNVVTWTALISGYGQHGQVVDVLELFRQMIEDGFRPNHVTFLAVLSACGHGGLVNEGWKYLSSMRTDFGIRPRGEHYAAIVDMLGRAGRLDEAYEFVRKLSGEEHSVIWGALLGASRIHGDVELGKLAAKRFFKMQPENAGKYIVLSNTFAVYEMWENVAGVRGMIRSLGIKKEPAWSLIEIQGEVHTFLVGDKSHEQSEMIYEMINSLCCALAEAGYVSDR
ncbi:pentatricopeptide repeat-containing protein At4g16470 [Phoenix dactylifera]|uniref:Pentatricopeptide repeat-containing protein At4g16470 n=1 Tax=Phoenix dactylifera TaxID=42345 RepID=A0A8B9A4J9_PHODC|nr:pentatricopeptide repeat-containing protein At4g16470-like [Phoenix dactylifera]XP_038979181.1 pentatricopeptide repeat-containing protein At4g16470 [Phoenix dactylifera]